LTLLFLRQFKLPEHNTYDNFTGQPTLPQAEVLELLRWQESINYFRFCLKKVLKDKNLLNTI